jgi:hypothetical protein
MAKTGRRVEFDRLCAFVHPAADPARSRPAWLAPRLLAFSATLATTQKNRTRPWPQTFSLWRNLWRISFRDLNTSARDSSTERSPIPIEQRRETFFGAHGQKTRARHSRIRRDAGRDPRPCCWHNSTRWFQREHCLLAGGEFDSVTQAAEHSVTERLRAMITRNSLLHGRRLLHPRRSLPRHP